MTEETTPEHGGGSGEPSGPADAAGNPPANPPGPAGEVPGATSLPQYGAPAAGAGTPQPVPGQPAGAPGPGYGAYPTGGQPGYGAAPGGYGGQPGYGAPPGYGAMPPMPPAYGAPYGGPVPTDVLGRPLAEWWQRLVAFIIDFVIVAIPVVIIDLVVEAVLSQPDVFGVNHRTLFGNFMADVIWIVLPPLYFGLMQGTPKGQSVGMMAIGIAVRERDTGGPVTVLQAGLRMFLQFLFLGFCLIPGLLDGLWPLWDPRREALHDKIVGTAVIQVK